MRVRVEVAGRTLKLDDGVLGPARADLAELGPVEPVRLAYAAAHVAMRDGYRDVPHSTERPGAPEELGRWIDWETTLELRRRLDAQGFAIAEAMDTAQRFELGWPVAEELIERCGALGLANGFVAGAGTDHLADVPDLDTLAEGVAHQARVIRAAGGEVIVLPLLELARWKLDEDGFVDAYRAILARVEAPVYLHWLGPAFHAELSDYFPGASLTRICALELERVRGVKLSLLDAARERAIRRELGPRGQIVLTGDDFHFSELIAGDGDAPERWTRIGERRVALGGFSHALLGALDAVAAPAALALGFLAHGHFDRYRALMEPCERLARHVFAAPTPHYKTGLAFLAWLRGEQPNAMLPNHLERAREREHLLEAAALASAAGALPDAELAAERLVGWV